MHNPNFKKIYNNTFNINSNRLSFYFKRYKKLSNFKIYSIWDFISKKLNKYNKISLSNYNLFSNINFSNFINKKKNIIINIFFFNKKKQFNVNLYFNNFTS